MFDFRDLTPSTIIKVTLRVDNIWISSTHSQQSFFVRITVTINNISIKISILCTSLHTTMLFR